MIVTIVTVIHSCRQELQETHSNHGKRERSQKQGRGEQEGHSRQARLPEALRRVRLCVQPGIREGTLEMAEEPMIPKVWQLEQEFQS